MIRSVSTLLIGMAILLAGSGLLGTALGLRAAYEAFDSARTGIVMAGYFVGFVAGYWICPPIIRRVGFVRAFAAFAALTAAVSIAYALYVQPVPWFALRVVNGIGLVGIYMVIESWLGTHAGAARGRVLAAYMTMNMLGMAAGQALVDLYPIEEVTLFAIAAGLFCLGLVPIALTPVVEPARVESASVRVLVIYRTSPTGFAGGLVSGMVTGGFWSLAAVYAVGVGAAPSEVAIAIAAAVLGGAVFQTPIGWLSSRTDRRIVLIAIAIVAGLAMVGVWTIGERMPQNLPMATFGFGAAGFAIYGLSVAQTQERFAAGDSLEATKGLLLVHGIGAIVAPMAMGIMMRAYGPGSFPITMAFLCAVLALFCAWRMRIEPPVPVADREPFVPVNESSPAAAQLDPRAHSD
ncbi:MAG: MFS transporter [Burkholderiaceae bacterium]